MTPRTRSAATLLTLVGLTLAAPAASALAAEPVPVSPVAPIVADDTCGIGQDTVQIPETEGITYSVTINDERAILPEGVEIPAIIALYASIDEVYLEQTPPELTMKLDATADDGYVLAPDAASSTEVTVDSSPCAPVTMPALKVSSDECEQVTITNPAGNPEAYFITTELDSLEEYDTVIPAGSSTTLDVPEGTYEWNGLDSSTVFGWAAGVQAEDGGSDLATRRTAASTLTQNPDATSKVEAPDVLGTQRAVAADEWELSAEDIDALREFSAIFDGYATGAFNLGFGDVDVDACADDPVAPTPPTTPAADPVDETPQVPAVVQTDGGPTDNSPAGAFALLGAGLLLAGGSLLRGALRR